MKSGYFPPSKLAQWKNSSFQILTSDVVAGRIPGPPAPSAWSPLLHQLENLSRKPVAAPPWWTPLSGFFGGIETRLPPHPYDWDGTKRLARGDAPLFAFQLTLAGFGNYQPHGKPPRPVHPGTAFIAIIPSKHRYYLPKESQGWTFAYVSIHHPYLFSRMTSLVARTGPLVDVAPDGPLAAVFARLVRGAIKKDFRDQFEVELALFEFLVACEQAAQRPHGQSLQGEKILESTRARILAALPNCPDVGALAYEHGMSRTHFSHFFRGATGLTPARFCTEVRIQQATRLLQDTRNPLKQIAVDCGFANANYFCKVFRRLHHMSPDTYRRILTNNGAPSQPVHTV